MRRRRPTGRCCRQPVFSAAVDSRRIIATRDSTVDASEFDQVDGKWASVLEHERIPFVSYPYEWTFGMLRDVALLRLDLLLDALEEDLILKDASAYNVQWFGSQSTMIDTPSFQRWKVGDPWVGYQQFCQLFLYPLMVKVPGQKDPQLHDTKARTIDILATIADVLDVDLPRSIDGRSLFDDSTSGSATVVIHRNDGRFLKDHLELPNQPDAKYRALDRKLELFGAGNPLERLFFIGEFGQLVGRRAADFGPGSEVEFTVALADAWSFENVDLDEPFLPAHIVGRLTARTPFDQPLNLAIAVNGKIRASTKTYSLPEEIDFSSFSAMVSESSFVSGRNLIMVYLVEQEEDGSPRLNLVPPNATVSYTLRRGENGEPTTILSSDGRTITVKPEAIRVVLTRDEETISGVAHDVATIRPAESILVFSGAQFLFSADVWRPTPSLVTRYRSEAMAKAGFQFTVPAAYLDNNADPLRIFAIIDSTATEFSQSNN